MIPKNTQMVSWDDYNPKQYLIALCNIRMPSESKFVDWELKVVYCVRQTSIKYSMYNIL